MRPSEIEERLEYILSCMPLIILHSVAIVFGLICGKLVMATVFSLLQSVTLGGMYTYFKFRRWSLPKLRPFIKNKLSATKLVTSAHVPSFVKKSKAPDTDFNQYWPKRPRMQAKSLPKTVNGWPKCEDEFEAIEKKLDQISQMLDEWR